MNESLFQTPVDVTDVRLTRNRGAIIKLETEEDMDDATIAKLSSYVGNRGWFFLGIERIRPEDVNPPPLPENEGKSPSQRLRACLYVLSEQKGIPPDKRNEYYAQQMERIINRVKEELDPV